MDGEDLNKSKKLLSVILESGREKEETGKGRLEGELGGGGREDVFIFLLCSSQSEPGPERVQ